MNDKEIIEVVQAHSEGKQIQFYNDIECKWVDCKEPCWAFNEFKYRVKPEPGIRPYKNCEECWSDMQKHEPFGWLYNKNAHYYFQITNVTDNACWEYQRDNYVYTDGSPFGIEVKG